MLLKQTDHMSYTLKNLFLFNFEQCDFTLGLFKNIKKLIFCLDLICQ